MTSTQIPSFLRICIGNLDWIIEQYTKFESNFLCSVFFFLYIPIFEKQIWQSSTLFEKLKILTF